MADEMERRVSNLEDWRREDVEPTLRRLSDGQLRIEGNIAEINTRLGQVATKSDVENAVNGILDKALDAIPGTHALAMQQRALGWQVFAAVVFAVGFALTILKFVHGN